MSKKSSVHSFSEQQLKELKAKFQEFDTDNSGKLEEGEIKNLIKQCGLDSSISEIVCFLFSGPDGITFKNFTKFLLLFSQASEDSLIIFRTLFEKIDKDHNGSLDLDEFRLFDRLLGFGDDDEETRQIFEETDVDSNGRLTFEEVCEAFGLE